MRIAIATPLTKIATTGNRGTSEQWASFLRDMGHSVEVGGPEDALQGDPDLLIALHGWKTRTAIQNYKREKPEGNLVVALTGTDIYPEPNSETLDSIREADWVVIYQQKAAEKVPTGFHDKVRLIPQSAEPAQSIRKPNFDTDSIIVCVVGHLRDVKDPMRAAEASRLLPTSSRIRIRHAGGILEEKYEARVQQEIEENPRYEFIGELNPEAAGKLIAESHAMVLSSVSEGGARVAGEAFINRTPLISSRIDGVIGLVGTEDYPGFFPTGDTQALAEKLNRFETDPEFRNELTTWTEKLAPRFEVDAEKALLRQLIEEFEGKAADQK